MTRRPERQSLEQIIRKRREADGLLAARKRTLVKFARRWK